MQKSKIKPYIQLHLLLVFYTLGAVCSKLAGNEDFFSIKFIFLYGLVLLNLFVYALVWQQILKKLPLVTAFANKAVTVIWGLIWGMLIFKEEITVFNIIGAVIIIIGICLVVSADEK